MEIHTYVGFGKIASKEKKKLIFWDPTKIYTQTVSAQGQISNVNLPMHVQRSLQQNCTWIGKQPRKLCALITENEK